MRNALLLAPALFLLACSGAIAPAPTQNSSPIDRPGGPCGGGCDAGSLGTISVAAGDTIEINLSGGMPAYCGDAGPAGPWSTDYIVNLSGPWLALNTTSACPQDDGGAPLATSKNVNLSAADAATILSLANALTLHTVTTCGADAPDQRVTITHEGASKSWLVDASQNDCAPGDIEIGGGYEAFKTKLDALLQ